MAPSSSRRRPPSPPSVAPRGGCRTNPRRPQRSRCEGGIRNAESIRSSAARSTPPGQSHRVAGPSPRASPSFSRRRLCDGLREKHHSNSTCPARVAAAAARPRSVVQRRPSSPLTPSARSQPSRSGAWASLRHVSPPVRRTFARISVIAPMVSMPLYAANTSAGGTTHDACSPIPSTRGSEGTPGPCGKVSAAAPRLIPHVTEIADRPECWRPR